MMIAKRVIWGDVGFLVKFLISVLDVWCWYMLQLFLFFFSSPAPGFFNDDEVLDFMIHLNFGAYPSYNHSMVYIIFSFNAVYNNLLIELNILRLVVIRPLELAFSENVAALSYYIFYDRIWY